MIRPRSQVTVSGRAPVPAGTVADTARTVKAVLRREGRTAVVSVSFVGRDRMRGLHRRYKGARRVTDVLAFTLRGPSPVVVGDVYVCPWVARREARRRRVPFREELRRYVVHGTLHVLGYDHPNDEARTATPMWQRQERYVKALR